MYHSLTKPDFVLITDPPIDIPDEYPNPTPGGPPPPESIILTCACGAEATLFPLDAPALCYDCAFATTSAGAVTTQSIAIDATLRRNRQCPNCGAAHHGWQCPSIARRLFALEGAA